MRRLIVLRPEPGASASVAAARARGLDAIAIPLFAVEPRDWETPDAGSFDGLLLTSANAVRHAGDKLTELRGLKAYAVGEATAAAAREAGFDIAATGAAGVERLLGSIEADVRLLHLCGEDRLEVDARQSITPLPVYRAKELPSTERLAAVRGQTVAVHSQRAARRFAALAEEGGIDRAEVRIAAISAAAAAAAGEGWGALEAADKPEDEALLALAARLCDKPDPE